MFTSTPETHELTWTVPDRLRKARTDAGLRQVDLAQRIGIHRQSVVGAENGRFTPRPAVIQAWAKATGVPVEALTGSPAGTASEAA